MHFLKWIILVVLAAITFPAAAQSSLPDEFAIQTDPVSLIGAYYNAINRGDYARAYGYWEAAPLGLTQEQFAAGFADTLQTDVLVRLPVYVGVGAGNAYANVPTMLITQHRDGTTHYFAGCFTTHKVNVPVGNATEPDPNWTIQRGRLREYQSPDVSLLETACDNMVRLSGSEISLNQFNPVQLIQSYSKATAG